MNLFTAIKRRFTRKKPPTVEELTQQIQSTLEDGIRQHLNEIGNPELISQFEQITKHSKKSK
jgi:hypothetical protein